MPQDTTERGVPQVSVPLSGPQVLPSRLQKASSLSATQPHTEGPPPPQVCGLAHVPQEGTERGLPQVSVPLTAPQFFPSRVQNAASVSATQPHTLATPPPPHVWGLAQVPHDATERGLPQLSVPLTAPQLLPRRLQNAPFPSAEQLQTLALQV